MSTTETIMSSLVPGAGPGVTFSIDASGRARIASTIRAAIARGDLEACMDGFAMIGFLQKVPGAEDAVRVLNEISDELAPEAAPAFVADHEQHVGSAEARKADVAKLMGKNAGRAARYDEPPPKGTVKATALVPRDPRTMK